MQLRDYLYLDTQRLADYLAALEPGQLEEFERTDTRRNKPDATKDVAWGEDQLASPEDQESRIQQRLTISPRHSFGRLYDAIKSNIISLDESDEMHVVKRNDVVEVYGDFEQSPLTKMIESMFELMNMMHSVQHTVGKQPELQEVLAMMTVLFPSAARADSDVPMVSELGDAQCLFIAKREFILRDPSDFAGEMTVIGKVHKVLSEGQSLDLFDALNLIPRSLRRQGNASAQIRSGLSQLFTSWPQELGGPVDPAALSLQGPAVVVSPLAAFS